VPKEFREQMAVRVPLVAKVYQVPTPGKEQQVPKEFKES
jgi:hypothetical protein